MDHEVDDGAQIDGCVELDGRLSCLGVVAYDLGEDFGVLLDLEVLLGDLALLQLTRRQLAPHLLPLHR